MSYVKSFKSFQNAEKKAAEEVLAGANPVVAEQTAPTTQTSPNQQTTPNQPAQTAPVQPSVEADPEVQAARKAVTDATTNRDRAVAAKQTELEKLKADQDAAVNRATVTLNAALQKAATPKS